MATFGDWVVDDDGLYNATMDYRIPAGDLCDVREGGVSEWALHMIEKTWVNPENFVPALRNAFDKFNCKRVDWEQTLRALQADAYDELVSAEAYRRLHIDRSAGLSAGGCAEASRRTKSAQKFRVASQRVDL